MRGHGEDDAKGDERKVADVQAAFPQAHQRQRGEKTAGENPDSGLNLYVIGTFIHSKEPLFHELGSERANRRASGPVLYASIPESFGSLCGGHIGQPIHVPAKGEVLLEERLRLTPAHVGAKGEEEDAQWQKQTPIPLPVAFVAKRPHRAQQRSQQEGGSGGGRRRGGSLG